MKKLKEWCKKHASEIVVGIICTIIPTAFVKLWNLLVEVGPTAGNSLVRFVSNYFYISLSKATEYSVFSMFFSAVFGFGVVYIVSLAAKGFSASKSIINDASEIITKLHNKDEELPSGENKPKITDEEIENEAKKIVKQGKKMKRLTIICIMVFAIYFTDIFAFTMLPNAMWREYQRDIIKIAPYVENKELEIIKSNWTCMQTKEDYDNIYEYINKVKKENQLP